ncbi:MAG: hypothetical protein N2201_06965 [candidate division WOR-3 bacterium]|nr:hypothetical protein [candidate division WOR-3 bacterium]
MATITIKSMKSVLIPIDEYDEIKKTIKMLSSQPNLPKKLCEERSKIEKSAFISFRDFKKKYL